VTALKQIVIYDVLGRVIRNIAIHGETEYDSEINTSALPGSGTYYVTAYNAHGKTNAAFIVSR